MHSIRNFRLAALGTVMLAGASAVAVAQPPARANGAQGDMQRGERGGKRGGKRGDRAFGGALLRGITLTDAQKTQLQSLQKQYADARPDSARRGMRGGANGAVAGAQRQRPDSAMRARMLAEREAQFAKQASDLRAILTNEQRSVFDQNVRTVREGMAARAQGAKDSARRGGKGRAMPQRRSLR